MLPAEESKVFAERVRGVANSGGPDEFGLVGEALSNRADIEKQRMERMNYYVWLMRKAQKGERLEPYETDYINQVKERTQAMIRQTAQSELQHQKEMEQRAAATPPPAPGLLPEQQRKVATVSGYRPGMEILPDQEGLQWSTPAPSAAPPSLGDLWSMYRNRK